MVIRRCVTRSDGTVVARGTAGVYFVLTVCLPHWKRVVGGGLGGCLLAFQAEEGSRHSSPSIRILGDDVAGAGGDGVGNGVGQEARVDHIEEEMDARGALVGPVRIGRGSTSGRQQMTIRSVSIGLSIDWDDRSNDCRSQSSISGQWSDEVFELLATQTWT
jgi:hypothetical protein